MKDFSAAAMEEKPLLEIDDPTFDPTKEWFFKSEDDWVIRDEEGKPYLRCLFAGKVYRLYLSEEG